MSSITGEGRFTADFRMAASGIFPEMSASRCQIGLQALYLRSGTAADQVDKIHALRYTFVADTPQEIDLLTLVGPRIRILMVKFGDGADAAAWLRFGGAATDAWSEIGDITIRPGSSINHGGLVLVGSGIGFPVSGTSKILKMLPSTHEFSVDLMILGASA